VTNPQKVALVTGASAGLGQVMACRLLQAGYRVYGTGRNTQTLAAHTDSSKINMIQMDVRNDDSVSSAIDQIMSHEQCLDLVINNAGVSASSPIEALSIDKAQALFDTNVWGMLRVNQAILPIMRKQRSGLIVNVSSLAGLMGLPYRSVYSASKASVEMFTESLRMEVAQFGIKVCMIEPGDLKTDIFDKRDHLPLDPDSPYEPHFSLNMQTSAKEMHNAPSPQLIGDTIITIINTEQPRVRYTVGTPVQKLTPILKRLLPALWFEKLLKRFFQMP
jgi:NADP-dependent 3-hydroxy acid dehydrogenase YdfG